MTEASSVILARCKTLQPAVETFIGNESKLHLALTHVISSLTSTITSLQEIVNIVESKSGKKSNSRIKLIIAPDSSKSECFQKILNHYTQILSTVSCLERYANVSSKCFKHKIQFYGTHFVIHYIIC